MGGVASLEQFDEIVHRPGRNMSANYAIDKNARVGLFCSEADRSWCSSSAWNDNRAITIEVSNSKLGDPWPVSDKVYAKLIDLCVDICQRNNIKALTFTGDKNGSLTFHKFFAATGCVPIHSTEVLTKYGWKMLDEVTLGEEILAADPKSLTLKFMPIQNMVPVKKDYVYNVNGMTVTNDHRVLCSSDGLDYQTIKYGSLMGGTEYTIPSAGFYPGTGLDITASEMVFLMEAQKHCQINLDTDTLEFVYIMEGKIAYFDTLLKNIGFEFERYHENLGPVHFVISDKRAMNLVTEYLSGKDFNWKWLNMSSTQFSYYVYKMTNHENGTWRRIYHADSLINANIFQAICAMNGRGTYLDYDKMLVYVYEPYRTIDVNEAIVTKDVEVSCVTVESGYFLMRQNGMVTITGNCPGPYLSARAQDICNKVNARLGGGSSTIDPPVVPVTLKTGVLVSIASTAVYYDGKSMPSWVKNQKWYVYSVSGDRVIINKNEAGTSAIMSAVNAKYLTVIQNASAQPAQTPFKSYTKTIVAGSRIYTIYNNAATFKTTMPSTALYTIVDETTIAGVKYGKLKSGIGWVNLGSDTTVVDSTIRVGDKVSVLVGKTYDGKSFKVYEKSYKVLEVKGDRVVISSDGKNVTAAVKASNLKKL
jgi:hypothetical protein